MIILTCVTEFGTAFKEGLAMASPVVGPNVLKFDKAVLLKIIQVDQAIALLSSY